MLSDLHEGVAAGHGQVPTSGKTLVGYRCVEGKREANCTRGAIRGVVRGSSYVVRPWGTAMEPAIIGAYNRAGRRHWSRERRPLFRAGAYAETAG